MIAVVDTNILVSALWTPNGNASFFMSKVINGTVKPCYDNRMLSEYRAVLKRPKFCFPPHMVDSLLGMFAFNGIKVMPSKLTSVTLIDEDDRPFYEVAKFCNAPLVTGNLKHYPPDPLVMTLADYINTYLI